MVPLMTSTLTRALSLMLFTAKKNALSCLLLSMNLIGLPAANAQNTQYISDMVLVPVRTGAGSEFRIVNRGLPSGTALLVYAQSDDGEWTEVETRGGTRGWIPTQYLQQEPPAGLLINDMRLELEQVRGERDRVVSQLNQSSSEVNEADETIVQLEHATGKHRGGADGGQTRVLLRHWIST
jgi:SH3 domain protein